MSVNVASGTLHFKARDISIPGRFPMRWDREYRSSPGSIASPLGPGWNSPYFVKLTRVGKDYRFYGPSGGAISFPDPGDEVERGKRIANLGAYHEIEKKGLMLRVTKWSPDDRSILRWFFFPDRNGELWPLRAVEDGSGHGLDLSWDDRGLLKGVRQKLEKRTLVIGHNAEGRLTNVGFLHADGHIETLARYQYQKGMLAAAFDCRDQADRYEYDGHGRMARQMAKDGGVFSYKYDDKGRCIRSSGAGNYDLKIIRYLDHIGFTEAQDSYGKVTRYQWLPSGQVVLEMDAMGGARKTEYDGLGRIAQLTDAMDGVVKYAYDANGNRCGVTDALGQETKFTFDLEHRPIAYIDQEGGEWKREYDAAGRVLETVNPLGETYRIEYDPRGLPVKVTAPDGAEKRRTFSEKGEVAEVIGWGGAVTRYRHDAMGRRDRIIAPDGAKTGLLYDSLGNLIEMALPSGARLKFAYDAGGNRTSVVDGLGRATTYRYGTCRRLLEKISPGGGRVRYFWGSEPDRLERIENQSGESYHIRRDAAGRVASEISFDGREWRFEYDLAGRTRAFINALGERIAIERDALGRVVSKALPDGSKSAFAYDKRGNLIGAEGPDGKTALLRDPLGRLIREEQDGDWVGMAFGERGRIKRVESSLGYAADYLRDAEGEVEELLLGTGDTFRFEHDQAGRETARGLPGGFRLEQGFNPAGRMIRQEVKPDAAHPGPALQRPVARAYAYDGGGKVSALEDAHWGRIEYAYDETDHLVGTAHSSGMTERFAYDTAGNPIASRRGAEETSFAYAPGNRMTRCGDRLFEYDAQGRLIRRRDAAHPDSSWTYAWNALDQLRSVTAPEGAVWTFRYDALGRRIGKSGPDGEVRYVWNRDVLLHEVFAADASATGAKGVEGAENASNTWIHHANSFVPIATIQNGKTFSVITDHMGTPKELIDKQGGIAWADRLGPWGDVRESAGPSEGGAACPLRFQGQWADAGLGLHYNQFRYFDPQSMRFISQDPVSLRGGMNLYAYVTNPINMVDPLGLCEEFPNQLPEKLDEELERADQLGVKPLKPGDPGFEDMVNSGKVKWAVTTDGELHVIPHSLEGGEEIPHTVATGGKPVLAAGEADIAGTDGQYQGLDIDNHSGHYKPSEESTQVGRDAFSNYGITFP